MRRMNDLSDVVDTARAWLRWSWLAVLAAVVAFFASGVLADQTGIQPTATATLALTDEVEWPFFDAVIVRQAGHLDDGEILAAAASAAGTNASDVTLEVSGTEDSASILTLSVTAENGAQSAEIANAVADAMVARDSAQLTQQREADVAALASTGSDGDPSELARAEAALAENRPEINVADRADAPSGATSRSSLPIVAALVAGLGALLAAPALERRLGAVQGPNHVELAQSGIRWIDTGSTDDLLPIAQAGDAIAAPFVGPTSSLAVASVDDPADAGPIAKALASRIGRPVTEAGALNQARATEECVLAQNVALVVRRGVTKRRRLKQTLQRFDSLGVNVEGVIMLAKSGSASGSRAAQAEPAAAG